VEDLVVEREGSGAGHAAPMHVELDQLVERREGDRPVDLDGDADQLAARDRALIFLQRFVILDIQVADLTDGAHAEVDEITVRVGGIALKAAVQGAALLREGQAVGGKREMIHADVGVAGRAELVDRELQQRESRGRIRQFCAAYLPLRLEYVRHVGIAVDGHAVGTHFGDAIQGRAETRQGLLRQPVDQVEIDGAKTQLASRVVHACHRFGRLQAVYRKLHRLIEILHAQADSIEPKGGQQLQHVLVRCPRIDLDRIVAVVLVGQLKFLTDPADQLEYNYRIGRIYDALNRKTDAMAAYQEALRLGEHRREYYGARAALQIGYIYESRGDKKEALIYFKKVLEMKSHDYKNALDQKAKAGIERCAEG